MCNASLTRAILSALEMSIAHIINCHTNVLFTYLLTYFPEQWLVAWWSNAFSVELAMKRSTLGQDSAA